MYVTILQNVVQEKILRHQKAEKQKEKKTENSYSLLIILNKASENHR